MDLDKIKRIIEVFDETNIKSLDLEFDDIKIKLEKNHFQPKASNTKIENNPKKPKDNKTYIKSSLVGIYHDRVKPTSNPLVTVGAKVKKGDLLGIIESMKLKNGITAPKDGILREILLSDGQSVEYDQLLFIIE